MRCGQWDTLGVVGHSGDSGAPWRGWDTLRKVGHPGDGVAGKAAFGPRDKTTGWWLGPTLGEQGIVGAWSYGPQFRPLLPDLAVKEWKPDGSLGTAGLGEGRGELACCQVRTAAKRGSWHREVRSTWGLGTGNPSKDYSVPVTSLEQKLPFLYP